MLELLVQEGRPSKHQARAILEFKVSINVAHWAAVSSQEASGRKTSKVKAVSSSGDPGGGSGCSGDSLRSVDVAESLQGCSQRHHHHLHWAQGSDIKIGILKAETDDTTSGLLTAFVVAQALQDRLQRYLHHLGVQR